MVDTTPGASPEGVLSIVQRAASGNAVMRLISNGVVLSDIDQVRLDESVAAALDWLIEAARDTGNDEEMWQVLVSVAAWSTQLHNDPPLDGEDLL